MAFNAKKLINLFLDGKAELTRLAYSKDLEDFRVFVKAGTVEGAVTRLLGGSHAQGQEQLARYLSDMKRRRDLGSATINRRLSTLRSLGKQSRILGLVPWVLEAANVRHEYVRDTRGPGMENVIKLVRYLEALPKDKPALRDLAIIRLMTDLALRRGAIVRLDMADYRSASREILVREKGKRSKQPRALSAAANKALAAWVGVRGPHSGALFVNFDLIHHSKTGKRITGSAVYGIVRSRAAEAGIKGPIRPHGIRHTAIVMAGVINAKAGRGLDTLKDFSGHADVRTLQLYMDKQRDVSAELTEGVSTLINR